MAIKFVTVPIDKKMYEEFKSLVPDYVSVSSFFNAAMKYVLEQKEKHPQKSLIDIIDEFIVKTGKL